jgi:hypothetical protein
MAVRQLFANKKRKTNAAKMKKRLRKNKAAKRQKESAKFNK